MKALIIIDMQMEMQRRLDSGRDCVNADAPERIAALAATYRNRGLPVIHIRHRDDDLGSPMHQDAAGYPPMPCAEALEGEAVFIKQTSSAFASTDLAAHLHQHGITELVVTGAVAGFCVNSTVRNGSDLGFTMTVVKDAILGFDLPHADLAAQVIFDVTMAHLEADFARLVQTSAELAG
ncbi:isochorismatase family protein [Donghicola tyrosinivorans]|uniref:Nicotinamidase-related amidase n=1 Tax=Donghicola tyrosinivorans TaxID=1652492 RepID=A0A2T0X0G1_9RHOB|nr:isochorismatase family protein [Donghicola tyrosinivorans]PRY92443.1 nicotinamidase-related amidase [Donghicola tyrosinivorans]